MFSLFPSASLEFLGPLYHGAPNIASLWLLQLIINIAHFINQHYQSYIRMSLVSPFIKHKKTFVHNIRQIWIQIRIFPLINCNSICKLFYDIPFPSHLNLTIPFSILLWVIEAQWFLDCFMVLYPGLLQRWGKYIPIQNGNFYPFYIFGFHLCFCLGVRRCFAIWKNKES